MITARGLSIETIRVTGTMAYATAMTLEIIRILDEGWASSEAIDDSIKYGLTLRRTTIGSLMKADVTDLDMPRRSGH